MIVVGQFIPCNIRSYILDEREAFKLNPKRARWWPHESVLLKSILRNIDIDICIDINIIGIDSSTMLLRWEKASHFRHMLHIGHLLKDNLVKVGDGKSCSSTAAFHHRPLFGRVSLETLRRQRLFGNVVHSWLETLIPNNPRKMSWDL